MRSYRGRFEPTRFEDLTVTVDFHCHSACRFCIAAEGLNYFKGVPFEVFEKTVADNVQHRRYRRVTFTGGEVALEKRLFRYVDCARESRSFEHIRLQTNGRPMASREFTQKLIEAGVDEFFVSLHGPNADVQDYTAQRPGSFDETIAGLQHIKELGAVLMTNTVLTTINQECLSDIVETVAPFEPASMEFWNYLPMEDYADQRDLLVPMAKLGPALREALGLAKAKGIPTAVKYVPQCLLGEHEDAIDNAQPDVVIVEEFYDVYPEFACVWEAKCEHAETCLGLTHPYITKFGWEESRLKPVPRTRPWQEPEYGLNVETHQPVDAADGFRSEDEPDGKREWFALIGGVPDQHGAVIEEMLLTRRNCVYRLQLADGWSVDLVLSARDESRRALTRSASFNVFYRNLVPPRGGAAAGEPPAPLKELLRACVRAVVARDPGGMRLDARKGLVGPEAFRRKRAVR